MTPPLHDIPPRLFMGGGNRNNVWRTFSTRDYAMAVCNLTGNKKTANLRHATLNGATKFIQYLHAHPFLPQLNRLSPANVTVTHVSLFDGSNEGIACTDRPAFSVQYHPEASPGPTDSHYLFGRFVGIMERKG